MKKLLLLEIAMMLALSVAVAQNRHFRFGDMELIAIQDTPSMMRAERFPGISKEEFYKLAGGQQAPSSVNVFVLKYHDKLVLLDTGNGGKIGAMLDKLGQDGISPEKIDFILLTHMHGDHIGGLLGVDGEAVFPRAVLCVAQQERDYWQNASGANGELVRKVLRSYGNRIKVFQFGEEVLPGIRALDASGHTPGHTVFDVGPLLVLGDLFHAVAIQMPRPEICATYDMDTDKSIKTRRRFCELALTSSKRVLGMHLPYPGIGRISRNEEAFAYIPEQ